MRLAAQRGASRPADAFWISSSVEHDPAAGRATAAGCSRPMTASAVMLLPQPDSPTSPNASPRPISNETSSTAL